MKKERLFKCLQKGRIGHYSHFKWPKVGVWVEVEGPLSLCKNGIHLCRKKDLTEWLQAEIYEAEYDGGERIDANNKIVVRKARLTKRLRTWNEKTARLFACDCAERVLPIFEKKYPDDKRPRQAIEIARKYALRKATRQELDTAGFAAGTAAWTAVWDAARAAEKKWQTNRLMEYLYPTPEEKKEEK